MVHAYTNVSPLWHKVSSQLLKALIFFESAGLPTFGIDIEDWPALASYMQRIAARPSVISARAAEAATLAV